MIAVKITREKIAMEHCYKGKNGTYLDMLLFENRDGQDKFGNDGMVVQAVSKEAREKGVKGPILGNWKRLGGERPSKPKAPEKAKPDTTGVDDDDGSVPF